MTEEEILKLSDEELDTLAAEFSGWVLSKDAVRMPDGSSRDLWHCDVIHGGALECFDHPPRFTRDIAAAIDLCNEIYNPMSKIRNGAWVLSTVDGGKDCSLATLFFGAPSRRERRQGRKNRPLKAQAKTAKKEMARAITLAYVVAHEGATVDLRYQPEET